MFQIAASTRVISATFFLSHLSIPPLRVIFDRGQVRQSPVKRMTATPQLSSKRTNSAPPLSSLRKTSISARDLIICCSISDLLRIVNTQLNEKTIILLSLLQIARQSLRVYFSMNLLVKIILSI